MVTGLWSRITVDIKSVVTEISVLASAEKPEHATDITVVEGESITFNCSGNTSIFRWAYTAVGTIDVKFIHSGRKFADTVDQGRYIVIANVTGNDSSLIVLNVNEQDSGEYSCFELKDAYVVRRFTLNVIGMYYNNQM